MSAYDFNAIATFLQARSGLVLTADKAYLIESRLGPVARRHGLAGIDAIIATIQKAPDGALAKAVVEAMTTNETSFFRDQKPFEMFQAIVLPEMLKRRAAQRTIRIWSAACSSGQEPYSLGMILDQMSDRLAGWKVEIVATDLSEDILAKARSGVYTQFEVQRGLPIQQLVKYFTRQGDKWTVSDKLRKMVDFRTCNLLRDFSTLGQFDVVFCRNVLIYFDQATKGSVLAAIRRQMPNDGYLFLGGAETTIGVTDKFTLCQGNRGLYRPA